jgi:outer membrane protein OmpA-like peptidoglycan-associated protein
MMRIFVTFLSISFFSIFNATGQSRSFSRWSFTAEYVSTYFFGDMHPIFGGVIPSSISQLNYGATAEYAFTPIWGLGIDYYHLPFGGKNESASFQTQLDNTDIIGSVNFTKWIFPKTNSKFSVNGTLGVGFAVYTAQYRYPNPNSSTLEKMAHPKLVSAIPISLLFEYNVSKSVALGLRTHYRSFAGDNLEGVPYLNFKGVTNDYIGGFTFNIRYKLNALNKVHLRNINKNTYSPDSVYNNLEKRFNNQSRKLDSLLRVLAMDKIDTDGDGIPDSRDMELHTPKNAMVDCCGRAIRLPEAKNVVPEVKVKTEVVTSVANKTSIAVNVVPIVVKDANTSKVIVYDVVPPVYFELAKADIDSKSRLVIAKVAARLKSDKTMTVEIRGFCDVLGSPSYNVSLSQLRANNVMNLLVKEWGISSSRVTSTGKGTVMNPPSVYPGNRRCDFFFNK